MPFQNQLEFKHVFLNCSQKLKLKLISGCIRRPTKRNWIWNTYICTIYICMCVKAKRVPPEPHLPIQWTWRNWIDRIVMNRVVFQVVSPCTESLSRPSTCLLTTSMKCGYLPTVWRDSCVKPLYTSGNKSDIIKYRSVAKLRVLLLLNFLKKLIELFL